MFLLKVNKTKITLCDWDVLTSGAVGAFQVRFDFDDCWDGTTKTAVFSTADRSVSVILDQRDTCTIPWEVLQKKNAYVMVGVYGMIGSAITIPTILCNLGRVERGAEPGNPPAAPTPGEYQQIVAMMQNVQTIAESVRNDANNGVFNGVNGANGKNFTVKATVNSVANLPTVAEAGDAYFVGTSAPRDVYTFDGLTNAWVNQGNMRSDDSIGLGRNLLDNWYFVGAEIRARAGQEYWKDGTGGHYLDTDTKIDQYGDGVGFIFYEDGILCSCGAGNCYQKSGTFPINQRGQVAYEANAFAFDRFITNEVIITPDGLIGKLGSYIVQRPEMALMEYLSGKQVTMSALMDDGIHTGTFVYNGSNDLQEYCLYDTKIQGLKTTDGRFMFWFSTNGTLKAVKLELGDTQTLAHQENGVWVLNEIPSYGEELAKCQRYLLPLNNKIMGSGYITSIGTKGSFIVYPPCEMRTTPSLIISDGYVLIRCNGSDYSTGNTAVADSKGNSYRINFSLNNGDLGIARHTCTALISGDNAIGYLSAEL